MPATFIGTPIKRLEDPRLLRGQGTYIEDLPLPPNTLQVAFVRSVYPHATLASVSLEAARAVEGVVGAFDARDFTDESEPIGPRVAEQHSWRADAEGAVSGSDRLRGIHAVVSHDALRPCGQPPLARGVVRYVGEPIAVVAAETRALAQDAAELVEIAYEERPAVPDAEAAVAPGAPLLHAHLGDNLAGAFSVRVGDPDRVFARARRIVKGRFYVQRYTGMPLEGRGVAATWDEGLERLTVWSSTQWPHTLREALTVLLHLPEHRIHVVAPDVGGGFGVKQEIYPEEVVVPLLAQRLARPVRWVETRREHLSTAVHAREQWHDVEVAVAEDGTILGMRAEILCDQGAYTRSLGILCPSLTAAGLPGPYRIRHYACNVRVALTNKAPAAAYRGAGQPEAVFATERLVDRVARELGLDPAEVRRRNFIRPDEFPWDVGTESAQVPVIYDSGAYEAGLDRALAVARYASRRAEQAAERARGEQGRLLGIGLAAYVMLTGLGPYEGAALRIDATGKPLLVTGCSPHGQGTATVLAQLVAGELGLQPADVTVQHGDTTQIAFGVGTYASRNAVVAGSAALVAARQVREKVLSLAASLLETAPEDLELVAGGVRVKGAPGRRLSLAQLATAAAPGKPLPEGMQPGLEAIHYFPAPRATFASGIHVAVIEIDRDTLQVQVLDYVVVNDAGPLINPLIVEGQIVGGVAQGIGGALFEELAYDEQGQLIAQSLLDYCMPAARQVPPVRIAHLYTPSPLNPLGVKGLGEGGAMAPPAAIANAVEDALGHLGLRVDATPLGPSRIAELLRRAGARL